MSVGACSTPRTPIYCTVKPAAAPANWCHTKNSTIYCKLLVKDSHTHWCCSKLMPRCKKRVKNAVFIVPVEDRRPHWCCSRLILQCNKHLKTTVYCTVQGHIFCFCAYWGNQNERVGGGGGGGGVASCTDGVVQNCMKLYIYAHVLKWSYKVITTFLFFVTHKVQSLLSFWMGLLFSFSLQHILLLILCLRLSSVDKMLSTVGCTHS